MPEMVKIGDAEFKKEVMEATTPVLVDFGASWCAPCKALDPHIEALAAQYKGKIKAVKISLDDHQETAQAYGVRSLPTLLFFKGGKVVKQIVGAPAKAKLEEAIQSVV